MQKKLKLDVLVWQKIFLVKKHDNYVSLRIFNDSKPFVAVFVCKINETIKKRRESKQKVCKTAKKYEKFV